jgi:hypothetical protein
VANSTITASDLSLGSHAHVSITADANNRNEDPNAFLVAGGPVVPAAPLAPLTLAEAQAASVQAIELWKAAGLDTGTLRALSQSRISIAALPAAYLGLAAPGAIYLDPTAEGHGWFTGTSATQTPAAGQIDLVTVVAHELGHLFGLMDDNGTALMAPTLAPGVRILPEAADLLAPHTTLTAAPVSLVQTVTALSTAVTLSPAPGDNLPATAGRSVSAPAARFVFLDGPAVVEHAFGVLGGPVRQDTWSEAAVKSDTNHGTLDSVMAQGWAGKSGTASEGGAGGDLDWLTTRLREADSDDPTQEMTASMQAGW